MVRERLVELDDEKAEAIWILRSWYRKPGCDGKSPDRTLRTASSYDRPSRIHPGQIVNDKKMLLAH